MLLTGFMGLETNSPDEENWLDMMDVVGEYSAQATC